MISTKKIALIHIACDWMKRKSAIADRFDDDVYRDVLKRCGNVETASELDQQGFDGVMRYFTSWGFRSSWTERTFGKRPGMATPAQVTAIRKLWQQWSGSDDERALDRWLERSFKVATLRFLDRQNGGKAIDGLKAMIRRKQESSAA